MFSKIRSAFSGSPPDANNRNLAPSGKSCLSPKFPYSRPHFLALSEDQVQASADHRTRPIITPNHGMTFLTGYAECINAGKSKWNEDQAVSHHGVLKSGNFVMPYKFYALFDGHAGVGASICAANQMHHVVHERLVDTQDDIWADFLDTANPQRRNMLVIGALEAAFREMDDIIKEDRVTLQSSGGCTAIVAIFLLGQLFVANAGDSRAIICKGFGFEPMSTDFTPESDRSRIRQLAQTKPELLGNDFTYMEYSRQPRVNDLGKRILYRDAFMTGWAHKTIAPEDLKISIISGHGKRSRVMGTIGVTRGFGDHELVSVHQKVPIKPFLSCHPEVKVYNLTDCSSYDVLIMGTDGLWDVVDGHMVTQIVNYATDNFPKKEMCPTAAACLVGAARGSLKENCWMMKSGKLASVDDISVFVIPLYPCSHLTYKVRKPMPAEEESDGALIEDAIDNSSIEEEPAGSTTSFETASSDRYSLILPPQANAPKVTISGISLTESSKSKIVLQQDDECEDEEREEEIDEPLSTDVDTEDIETDENATASNRSSDQTEPIARSDDEQAMCVIDDGETFVLQEPGQLSGTSSETPLVSYSTEATSHVPHERTEPNDESSEDEFTSPDQRRDSPGTKKDFMNVMTEKQKQKGIHGVPFQYSVDTPNTEDNSDSISGAFNTLTIGSEQPSNVGAQNNSLFDYGTFDAQGDATATLESHIRMQREYEYHSGGNVKDTQKIVMETYVSTDSKSQIIIQEATKTEQIISLKGGLRLPQIPYDTDSSSPASALFTESPGSISEDAPFTPGRESGSGSTITEDTPSIIPDSSISSSDIDLLEPVSLKPFIPADVNIPKTQKKLTGNPVEDYYGYPKQERKHSPTPLQKHQRVDASPQRHPMFMIDDVQKQKVCAATPTVSDRRMPEYMQGSSKSPEPMRKTEYIPDFKRWAEVAQTAERMRKTEHARVSRSPEPMRKTEHAHVPKSPEPKHKIEREYKQRTAETRSPEPGHRTEHTRLSKSPEYKQRTADTRSPELRRRTEQPRVSHSPDYKVRKPERSPERTGDIKVTQQPRLMHQTEANPETMKQLQILGPVLKQQVMEREKRTPKLTPVRRSMSPPPQQVHAAYRERTNSFPPSEMVKPGPSRREQEEGARKKQYSQCKPSTSHEVKKKQEHVAATTRRGQIMPREIAAAEQEIRAKKQSSGTVKATSKSKSTPQRDSKGVLEEAKWEFYSDYYESDEDPPK